jgi:hypothetical protein
VSRVRVCFKHHAGSRKDTAPLSAVTFGSNVCAHQADSYLAYPSCLRIEFRLVICQGYAERFLNSLLAIRTTLDSIS